MGVVMGVVTLNGRGQRVGLLISGGRGHGTGWHFAYGFPCLSGLRHGEAGSVSDQQMTCQALLPPLQSPVAVGS